MESLDAAAVRRWCASGLEGLRRHQVEIDQLNVYPVPDGDTGTNLVLTITSAWQAVQREPETVSTGDGSPESEGERLARVLRAMARGALLGARGNSGVIVSQILRGAAESLARTPVARGRALAEALASAAKAAYAAVAEPVEGTILTVANAAAEAALAADTDDLGEVVAAAARGAAVALARTPEQLPVLARAGVVDAGGRGLVVLLDAFEEVVTGRAARATAHHAHAPAAHGGSHGGDDGPWHSGAGGEGRPRQSSPAEGSPSQGLPHERPLPHGSLAHESSLPHESSSYEYEVQYLLEATADAVESLKAELAGLGDSLVVVGAGDQVRTDGGKAVGTWNVHVHVDDVGAAIEAGIRVGRPYQISVTRFADQPVPAAAVAGAEPAFDPQARATVVSARGDGLARIFAAEGAVVVDGGPTGRPSTADFLDAIRASRAGQIVLLPNDGDVHAVAFAAAEEVRSAGIEVAVIPTRSPVQALAALAVRDPSLRPHDEVIAMAEAAGACRYAGVTIATREALTVAGRCHPGDVLALVEGEVNLIGKDLAETCRPLLDRMRAAGGEMVTLVLGATAPTDLGEQLERHILDQRPYVEVHRYDGGQPGYPLLVGVE